MAEPEINEEIVNEEVEPEVIEPEQPELPEEPEQPEIEEPEVPEEPKVSRRADLRIKKLLEDNKRLRQQMDAPSPKGLDYGQALEADLETIAQLEQDRRQATTAAYSEGLKQAQSIQFRTRLEIDTPKIENKFPQLNPNDQQFDPVVADALNTHYLTLVGYDPNTDTVQNANLRYSDFIEAQYELAGALATKKIAQARQNITRQAAVTGLRPDGSAAKLNLNQDVSQMTDAELEAYGRQIGLSPKKR